MLSTMTTYKYSGHNLVGKREEGEVMGKGAPANLHVIKESRYYL